MSIRMLQIDAIKIDPGILPRIATDDDELVTDYVAILRRLDMPPILVAFDGSSYWLCDGSARLAAHRALGDSEIRCQVFDGSREAAIESACKANAKHGRPLSALQKRRAVELLLTLQEWRKRSDEQIADAIGCSPSLAYKIKSELGIAPRSGPGKVGRPAGKAKASAGLFMENNSPAQPQTAKAPGSQRGPGRPSNAAKEIRQRKTIRDRLDQPVPDYLKQVVIDSVKVQELLTCISDVAARAEKVKELRSGAGMFLDLDAIVAWVRELRIMVRQSMFYAVCMQCSANGKPNEDCDCGGRGWFSEPQYSQFRLNGVRDGAIDD